MFKQLRGAGIYFQKHYKKAPGTPDIACPSKKKAIFIHSDFWHGWRLSTWYDKLPNDFWREKITQNRLRDQRKIRQLRGQGWAVLVIWEHSLKRDFEKTIKKVARFLQK